MWKSTSTEKSFLAKKQNRKISRIISFLIAFAVVGVLTLSPAAVYAEVSDIQIWHTSSTDYDFHCYMSYQNNVPACGNLYNGTTPMYNLYEVPFSIAISRTNLDGSVPSSNDYHYIFGWGFKKIIIEFNANIGGVDVYPVVCSDFASVYIEASSYDSTNKKLTLDCFFTFDNFPVNRLEEVANFILGCRRSTSALNDTLSIVSVSTSDWQGSLQKSNKPLYGSLVESISQGINYSSDIDTIISVLNLIKQNSDLYSSVLIQLQSIGSDVSDIRDYLLSGNAGNTMDDAVQQGSAAISDYADTEESLLALAPADPADAYSLNHHFQTITTELSWSLQWWAGCIRGFVDSIGIVWTMTLTGLVIGLTAFILRLRK